MKRLRLLSALAIAAAVLLVTACGGGNRVKGSDDRPRTGKARIDITVGESPSSRMGSSSWPGMSEAVTLPTSHSPATRQTGVSTRASETKGRS